MDQERLSQHIDELWDVSIIAALSAYIRIPNKSPFFDAQWREHGHMQRAAEWIASWCRARQIPGLQVELVQLAGRTPVIFMEIPGTADAAGEDTVLLYGHLDKQPELGGWLEGTGPWQPTLRGDRLYGRGSADDGYAAFAALAALEALHAAGGSHARCVVLIEACEESGSYDLPHYVAHLSKRLGDVSFVVCLDSGCGDYERLWSTTSLRGLVMGNLVVRVLEEGVHSGDASGIVASSFRIARQLLSRLEDERTGELKLRQLHARVPKERKQQTELTAKVLKKSVYAGYRWAGKMRPVQTDPAQLLLRRTWSPTLCITAAAGLPDLSSAGNVLRASTTLKLSIRLPPTCDAKRATARVKHTLEKQPPYGALVRFEAEDGADGWDAPALAPWLGEALRSASRASFGKDPCFMGEGGSIPFMAMLGRKFPRAQFLITGVLGPQSNAHGPNEFLHLPTAKRVTACVARVLDAHAQRAPSAAPRRRRPAK